MDCDLIKAPPDGAEIYLSERSREMILIIIR